tara:strand:+ start:358 stop:600 length:243 start_codon:yes stop_codon:yes gene_type:complete
MNDKKLILKELNLIFKKVFKNNKISITKKTRKENILEWDSLGTVKLIIEIQKKYKISISPNESIAINNVNSLVNIISKKK